MADTEADELLARAWSAREHAYAPYSRFLVGAALLTEDGRVFAGANVENASYGLSICAERVAATKAVSEGSQAFRAIAVVSSADEPVSPCGACRQFLYEFSRGMAVISEGSSGDRSRWRLEELLPDGFGPEALKGVGER
jgi:cytidine deaminase